jgi:hypothetical protein
MKKIVLGSMLAVVLFAAQGCDEETAPTVDSDNGSASYVDAEHPEKSAKAPIDKKVYELTGEVVGPVNSVTRQVKPAEGSSSGFVSGSAPGGFYGYSSGSYFGEVTGGKGYVRLLVTAVGTNTTDLAKIGDVSILKVSDIKATALVEGDVVTVKCRRDFEAIAPVAVNQRFHADEVGTWELDYCRMPSAVIDTK